ncbi:MAG: ABC transporter ATP-binding protein [Desulfuromonadales bacterium]|nr:ABC transporter ATP-binding protein [Desulfuromonadales bacterium]
MRPVIEARGLVKHFGTVTAVAGIDFDVCRGELFGFLGPNGAGKTTTINLLIGLARPDRGSIHVAGIDCTGRLKAAQHLMGVVPDESNLYPELTGLENLCFCAALYGMPKPDREARARELLERFGLAEAAGRKFAGYSKGMKRKLTIAAGIIHRPAILFLDEPTTGIDVASARQIRQLIADLNRAGTTIFLTTHYIEEAERLCERIAFIVGGRIVRTDTVERLMEPVQERQVVEFALDGQVASVEPALRESFPELNLQVASGCLLRVISDRPVRIGPLVRFFEERGLEVGEVRKVRPTLEEVFVEITGIEAADVSCEKEKAGGVS